MIVMPPPKIEENTRTDNISQVSAYQNGTLTLNQNAGHILLFDCHCIGLTLSHTQNTTAQVELLNPPIPDSLSATQRQATSKQVISNNNLPNSVTVLASGTSHSNAYAASKLVDGIIGGNDSNRYLGTINKTATLTYSAQVEAIAIRIYWDNGANSANKRKPLTFDVNFYTNAGDSTAANTINFNTLTWIEDTDIGGGVYYAELDFSVNQIFEKLELVGTSNDFYIYYTEVQLVSVKKQVVDVVISDSVTRSATHRITIHDTNYDYVVTNTDTVQTVLNSLRTLITDNTSIDAQVEDNQLVLSSDNAFTYSVIVIEKARKKVATNNETSALINFADDPVVFKAGDVVKFSSQSNDNLTVTAWFKFVSNS